MKVKKIEAIEPGQSDVCHVTGLPILRKPEWTDVSFGKDYRVTVSIVGDSILRVQPSGHISMPDQKNVLRLTEQAPAEAIPGGQPYVHIEDWTNFQGASIAARKHYMDEMQTRKRISGVIFCHVSTAFKMSIKLGKTLRMVKFPVHIADDYSEAVRLALEIQSNGKALEDKPVIAPSKKNLSKDGFPSDEDSVCPVTSLPITTRPEWTDIPIGDNYSVSFSLIGNAILLSVSNGSATDTIIGKHIEEREKVLRDAGLKGKRYAEIGDHSMITTESSRKGRMIVTNLILKETNEGNLLGFWVFNAPFSVRLMLNVGVKLHKPSAPVGAVKDYREAMVNAVNVLKKSGVDVGVRQYKKFTKDEWGLELDDYGTCFELIGDDLIYTVPHGVMKERHVEEVIDLHEKVLEETGLTEKGYYYRIINWENLEKTTWKSRKMFIDAIRDLNRKIPCKLSVIFGLNKFMRTIIGFSKQFIPIPITTAHNFEEAVVIIEREREMGPESRIIKNKKRLKDTVTTVTKEKIRDYSDELLEFMGAINWDQEGAAREEISNSHPFKQVFDAMAIIKEDVDDLFRERKQSEERLRKSEERYRHIIEETTDVVYTADPMGYCTYVSSPGEKLTGYSADELIGRHFTELTRKDWRERVQLFYLKQFKELERETRLEFPIITKTGEERWVEQSVTLLSERNHVTGFQSILRDISTRKLAENALRKNEEKYRSLITNIPDVTWTTDYEFKTSFVSPNAKNIIGYTPEEIYEGGSNIFPERIHPEDAEKVEKAFKKLFDKGNMFDVEFRIKTKDGEWIWLHDRSIAIYERDGVMYADGVFSNITSRKQAEDALRESERKYRDIFENVTDLIYVHNLEGDFTETNLAWNKELGLTADDLAGLNVKDLMPEKYKDRFDDYLNRIKAKGKDQGLMSLVAKDGHEFIIEYRNSLVNSPAGPIGVRGSARDITEQIHAQRELRQSEEKYRTILENIEDGYFEVDLTGKLIFFNDALCRVTGYPRNELMGINNRDYMDEETAKKVYETYVRIFETGEPVKGLEYEIQKDGIQKHVETSVSLMKDRNGQSIGFRGILRDVSERKQAEETIREYSENLEVMVEQRTNDLKKSEEKYRTILGNIEDGYYEVDLAGNQTFFNDSLCKITGYPEHELMGMNNREYTDEENARKLYIEYNKVYETGIPTKRFEWEITRKDGKKRFMETSISMITSSEGRSVGFRGILRDVTERKKLEREFIEKSRLAEEASRAKSEFLANMSHEIRTPLNGIIGMAELALDTKLDDNQKNIFHTINTEANSLQDVINEVLDFSKIEAGKLDLEDIPFDLRIAIENVASSFAHKTDQKGLEFISFLSPDVPSRLIGDPGRLRQILANLSGNALKFTHEGEIYIKADMAEDLGDKVKIRFLVKDTGIGIPKEKQATIFESFTQADGSTTRKYGGTGLGTTISKQLAELMGGEIGVESEEGKGSTFWFTAVFNKQKRHDAVPAAKKADLKDIKVLVVDDNQTNRFVLTEYFRSWGCLPVEATNGKEALSILKESIASKEPFDLLLTDFQIPEMSGFDLAKAIKTMETLEGVPIIVLTSAGKKGDGRICKEIGINGYLTKPIRHDDLHKAIVSVLGLSIGQGTAHLPALVTRHSIVEDFRKEVQILLVEDYPTNQQVAMRHLIKEGYQVDLAEDGRQAVEAYKRKAYNLILMDIQMPIMDGYAATQEIREIETRNLEPSTIQRIPIIAMTAHAIKGYREKCLEAGMDDYIAKPLRRKDLLTMAEKWTGGIDDSRLKIDDCTIPRGNQGSKAPMEYERALEEFEGDETFLMEVLEGFIENVTSQIKIIRQAISDGDAEVVRRESHSIKGGAGNLTAGKLADIAFELENIGKYGMLEGGIDALEKLEQEFFRLEYFVAERDDIS